MLCLFHVSKKKGGLPTSQLQVVKNLTCQVQETEDSLITGQEDLLEDGMATSTEDQDRKGPYEATSSAGHSPDTMEAMAAWKQKGQEQPSLGMSRRPSRK